MPDFLHNHPWWNYIHEDLQELLNQSVLLSEVFADRKKDIREKLFGKRNNPVFHDYSFIVFPAAKAYEGFLKNLFYDLRFIDEEDFFGKRFRVGKALNPQLEKRYRDAESVYDRLVDFCQGNELADTLWDTWKEGRNMLFHWFPNERNAISYAEARLRIDKILEAMDMAFEECKINST